MDTMADGVADKQRNLLDAQVREIVKISADMLGGTILGGKCGPDAAGTFSGKQGLLDGAG